MQTAQNHICYTYEVCRFGFNPSTPHSHPSPCPLDCFLIIVQCAFAVHFVRLSKLLSPFFFLSKQAQQAKTTHRQRQKQLSVACCPFIIHFLPLECVCKCVRVCVWELSILCALPKSNCQLAQRFALPFATLSTSFGLFPASFLPLSGCCLLILCVCCCCLGQLAAVSCRLPLLVASNRINMLPMSVAAAYFKSKQAMFFLKPPPTQTHRQ